MPVVSWLTSQITHLHSYPFFPFFTVNTDFRKPINQLKKACSRCFGFGIVWGVGRSSSQRSSTGDNCRDHPVEKGEMVILGKPSGNWTPHWVQNFQRPVCGSEQALTWTQSCNGALQHQREIPRSGKRQSWQWTQCSGQSQSRLRTHVLFWLQLCRAYPGASQNSQ